MPPYVGLIVCFHNYLGSPGAYKGPLAAIVVKVISDDKVNLVIFDERGGLMQQENVTYFLPSSQPLEIPACNYCIIPHGAYGDTISWGGGIFEREVKKQARVKTGHALPKLL